jgi:hypothetical protein
VLKAMLATRLRQLFAIGLLTCGLIGVGGALAQQLGAPATDPNNLPSLSGVDVEVAIQKKQKAKDEEPPKKIGAKGIEDDDVPYGTFPGQAVVRLDEGKLIVRQRERSHEVVRRAANGAQVLTVRQTSGVRALTYDPADIAVFDMRGNRLSPKAWKELFKSDVHVLIAGDGRLPNPRELTLLKQDTLLVVLPTVGARDIVEGSNWYVAPSAVVPAPPASPALPAMRPAPPLPPPSLRPMRPAKPTQTEGGDLLPPSGTPDVVPGTIPAPAP